MANKMNGAHIHAFDVLTLFVGGCVRVSAFDYK